MPKKMCFQQPTSGKDCMYCWEEEVILGKMTPISRVRTTCIQNMTQSGLQHVKPDKACNCFTPPAEQMDSVDRKMANRKTLSR